LTLEEMEQKLNAKIEEYDLEINRLKAVTEIQNCMGHYEAVHITPWEIHKSHECFAMWREDVSVEVSNGGIVHGPEDVKKYWESMVMDDIKCVAFLHALATPVVQVAGNCKTAKVTWVSPGFECVPNGPDRKHMAAWAWDKYGMDFIKNPETNEWKIWHMKWFRLSRNDYHLDFVEFAKKEKEQRESGAGPNVKPPNTGNALPSFFHSPLSLDEITHPFPMDPEPYETYDGDFRWIFGGREMEEKYGVQYPAYEKYYNKDYPEGR